MKKCSECNGVMKEMSALTPEGVEYHYYKCNQCGEEMLNMEQLHNVAQKYRLLKSYHVKLSKWGLSLGVRIPKELAEKYKLKENKEVIIIPEKQGMKMIPA